jgi:hypothetical protein
MQLTRLPGRILFPHNTFRRLAVKIIRGMIRHPGRACLALHPARLGRSLMLMAQGEFAFLEDCAECFLAAPRGTRPVFAPTAAAQAWAADTEVVVYVEPGGETGLSRTLDSLLAAGLEWALVRVVLAPGADKQRLFRLQHPLMPKASFRWEEAGPRLFSGGKISWVLCLAAGDRLLPGVEALAPAAGQADADLVYGDDIRRNPAGRREAFFKPDWSPELLWSLPYVGSVFLVRRRRLRQADFDDPVLSAAGKYSLLLLAAEKAWKVRHAPALVAELCGPGQNGPAAERALTAALARRGWQGSVMATAGAGRRLQRTTRSPKISIIIPTALKSESMLTACLQSVTACTRGWDYEILLMENRGAGLPLPAACQVPNLVRLADPGIFHYAKFNNAAARRARGEYLVFLNDDTEVLSADWMRALLEHAQNPEIGVVGAHLLYPDRSTQHGGMFLVREPAYGRHAFRFLRRPENSYQGLLTCARNCSAVTFACAMVSRATFNSLGGLDENLRIECNDVDFCLRAWKRGLRNVWTPGAVLIHRELATRVGTHHPADMAFFEKRWNKLLEQGDPYYNSNLSQTSDMYMFRGRPPA